MGWFLRSSRNARRSSARSKKKKTAPTLAQRKWDPRRTLTTLRWAISVIVIVGAAAGWYFGEDWLRQRVAQQRAIEPYVVLHDLPPWMAGRLEQDLREMISLVVQRDPFDSASLDNAAQRVQADPWIERVERIVRNPRGRVDVYAHYRRPVALIESRGAYHVISDRAVRLPLTYPRSVAPQVDLPKIQGVAAPPPAVGQRWEGGDLQAALKLAQLVAAQPWADQVRAVDVSNYANRHDRASPQLALITENGLVRWGRAPGAEHAFEPPVTTKLSHIQRIVRQYRSIDAGGRVVDVFGDRALIHAADDRGSIRYTLGR